MKTITILLALLAPLFAAAESWGASTAELLKTAKNIELVKVSAVTTTSIEGTVSESLRGRAVGTKLSLDKTFLGVPDPTRDSEILVICDSLCPRAIGVDRGGYFVLWAQEPMDSAQVLPGLIERASLRALVAGKAAADLCVRANVTFFDEPGSELFEGSFAATDGRGEVTSKLLAKAAKASLQLRTSYAESSVLRLDDGSGVVFFGGPLTRAKDGCYEASTIAGRPLARTVKSLKSALAGSRGKVVLAEGKLHVKAGAGIKAGDYALSIELDRDGQLHFVSPLFASDTIQIADSKGRVGFSVSKAAPYPAVMIELGAGPSRFPEAGFEVKIAELISKGSAVTLSVFMYEMSSTGESIYTPLGDATLSHVPD